MTDFSSIDYQVAADFAEGTWDILGKCVGYATIYLAADVVSNYVRPRERGFWSNVASYLNPLSYVESVLNFAKSPITSTASFIYKLTSVASVATLTRPAHQATIAQWNRFKPVAKEFLTPIIQKTVPIMRSLTSRLSSVFASYNAAPRVEPIVIEPIIPTPPPVPAIEPSSFQMIRDVISFPSQVASSVMNLFGSPEPVILDVPVLPDPPVIPEIPVVPQDMPTEFFRSATEFASHAGQWTADGLEMVCQSGASAIRYTADAIQRPGDLFQTVAHAISDYTGYEIPTYYVVTFTAAGVVCLAIWACRSVAANISIQMPINFQMPVRFSQNIASSNRAENHVNNNNQITVQAQDSTALVLLSRQIEQANGTIQALQREISELRQTHQPGPAYLPSSGSGSGPSTSGSGSPESEIQRLEAHLKPD